MRTLLVCVGMAIGLVVRLWASRSPRARTSKSAPTNSQGPSNRQSADSVFAPINYYEILGVAPTSTTDEIRTAYRTRVAHYHPDRNASTDANAITALLNEAWKQLGDSARRNQYDAATHLVEASERDFSHLERSGNAHSSNLNAARGMSRVGSLWQQTEKLRGVVVGICVGAAFFVGVLAVQKRALTVDASATSPEKTPEVKAAGVLSATSGPSTSGFQNERLKALVLPDVAITVAKGEPTKQISGIWVPESKDRSKALFFPLQVSINCHNDAPFPGSSMALRRQHLGLDTVRPGERGCTETAVTLAPTAVSVTVLSIETENYDIDSWDEHGLIASHGGGVVAPVCQRHVLTMNFESGVVSVADIPTHKHGCEAYTETNSYRLVRGYYYVDTTPTNDADKPRLEDNK